MVHGTPIELDLARGARRTGAIAAIAMHVAIGSALLAYEPTRSAILAATPIMVSLISPPAVQPVKPVEPPKPKRVVKPVPKPPEPKPIIAAPLEAPSPSPVLVPPPPPPEPAAAPAPIAAPVVVAPPPLTEPVFNADYLDNPAPYYPQLARRAGEQGRVVLRVLVNARGEADEVEIRTSSGHARLDRSARDTVRRWRFVPAKRGEEPVSAWVLIPISFKLEG